jgi:hypothetical protein
MVAVAALLKSGSKSFSMSININLDGGSLGISRQGGSAGGNGEEGSKLEISLCQSQAYRGTILEKVSLQW